MEKRTTTMTERMKKAPKETITKGAKINIIDYIGNEPYEQEYTILAVEWSAWNDQVPTRIATSRGIYCPTSGADGYWEGEVRLNGWDVVGEAVSDNKE